MNFPINERVIESLCGRISLNKGASYVRAGKVSIASYDVNEMTIHAQVNSEEVRIQGKDDLITECTCSSLFSFDKHCKHTAAALLYIMNLQKEGEFPLLSSSTALSEPLTGGKEINDVDIQLTSKLMDLFGGGKQRLSGARSYFDTRSKLEVEFICHVVSYGFRKYRFGIEMKVGPKRTYIVQNIRSFLDRVQRRESYSFSKHFTYDPELYSFQIEHDDIVRKLIEISASEPLFHETSSNPSKLGSERMLVIPPYAWDDLYELLLKSPSIKLEHDGYIYDGIALTDGPPPLHFKFDQTDKGTVQFQLQLQGIEQMTVMEAYELVIVQGKLWRIPVDQCVRLSEMKHMLGNSGKNTISILPEQMEPFMEKVIPGLRKLGSVEISTVVSNKIVQTPLSARLYLDRVRDRLLAGLEFHYGNLIINPLQEERDTRGDGQILIRNGDQENRILELMEQSRFTRTEGGYFLDNEDDEYDFLYHIVPQLEPLLKIYATSAVKVRLYRGDTPPRVTVSMDERTEWLKFKFDMAGIPDAEVRNILKSLEEKRKYHKLPGGALMPLQSSEFQEIVRLMNGIGIHQPELKDAQFTLPVIQGLYFLDSDRQGDTIKLGKSLRQLLEHMRNPDHLDFPVPESLAGILRDYQSYGYQWMKTLAFYRFGGILADDMGLGKTIQGITFIVSVLQEIRQHERPALVVAPASLTYNWLHEFERFAPQVRVVIADGTKSERISCLRNKGQVDVVITSYPLLRRDISDYARESFHTLLLDEAQVFKNHVTQTAQAVKSLKALHRFALTGTPVENKLEELWTIFDAVFPELFTNRMAFHELSREAVAKRIRPFLLRRLKRDVLKELPEKIETLQASELYPEQKKLYAAYLAKLQHETLKHLNEKGFHKNRIKILAGITRLRQLCCHPALFVEGYDGGASKFEQLMDMIEECQHSGRRVLIFSQFTEMLGLIGRTLGDQGVPYFYLDGNTPAVERVTLCNRFNEGERDLFLASLKAGGTGLNLTGADTVILYDLWWNPAVEQQAADRAHRIGQKKVVQVIRLITQGTVEEKMYELQQKKKDLIEEIIQPGEEVLSALTEQEIREILMI